jgi:hypothetical protein
VRRPPQGYRKLESTDGGIEGLHTEFAERAARRLEFMADHLDEEGGGSPLDTVSARAKELRVREGRTGEHPNRCAGCMNGAASVSELVQRPRSPLSG